MWEQIRRGNAAAFENFYRDIARPLGNFLRVYVGNRQTAEDISQDAFVQLWRRPNGFNPERSTLKAYLFGVARHRAADWWRQQHPHPSGPPVSPVEPGSEQRALLADALDQLDPDVRGLLWLREVEGHSYRELAEMLDIPLDRKVAPVWSG